MRTLTYSIILLLLIVQCAGNPVSTTNPEELALDSLKQEFVPALNGVWVATDYLKSIDSTKSPLKSAGFLNGVVAMMIDETTDSDSVNVEASWNNHEGMNFSAYFVNGQTKNSLTTNLTDYELEGAYYELGYETINEETFLFLYHYDQTKKLIDKKSFTQVGAVQPISDASWGIQNSVNEKLFSGDYQMIDSANVSTNVTFTTEGQLIGYPKFETYRISTDFLGGPEPTQDEIGFNDYALWYAFEIKTDTTYLYSVKGNQDEGELLEKDELKYRLVRQK